MGREGVPEARPLQPRRGGWPFRRVGAAAGAVRGDSRDIPLAAVVGMIGSIAHRLAGDDVVLPVEGPLSLFAGAAGWPGSEPLTPEGLRGRVVLVDFWTYTCVNWLRTL